MSKKVHIWWLVIIAIFLCSYCYADKLYHEDGLVIEGTITHEDKDKVEIETERYGTLVFKKANLQNIEYDQPRMATPQYTPLPGVPQPTATPSSKSGLSIFKVIGKIIPGQTGPGAPQATPVTPPAVPGLSTATPTPSPDSSLPLLPIVTPSDTLPGNLPEILPGFDAVLFDVIEDARVRHSGGNWENAYDKMQLKVGDEIVTSKGKLKIRLRGRGELRLPTNSHLIIERISPDGSEITVELKGGRVWNHITPGAGVVQYTIRTPDLTAGVIGTLFKVNMVERGSRVAVFEGKVVTVSEATRARQVVETDNFVTVDKLGQISAPAPVNPEEREEWDEWDQWALEVHEQIASRFVFGGQAIDNLARLVAEDGKRYDAIMSEANQRILTNREETRLNALRDAFIKFYQDTGLVPTSEQGFRVLLENPGLAGWQGPYVDVALLKDRWGSNVVYEQRESRVSGNKYGVVISPGPDRIFSKGQVDDLMVIIPYYSIQK